MPGDRGLERGRRGVTSPRAARAERSHGSLPHTADAGITAAAPALPGLFEELAAALGEITADLSASPGSPELEERVVLTASDLPALAFAWLNELIGISEIHRAAVARADVEAVGVDTPDGVRLEARVLLVPFASEGARPRTAVKSATMHRLEVQRRNAGWRAVTYLDL